MHEKPVSHTRIQEFVCVCVCVCVGGGGSRPACLKTTLTFFLVINFNILHFTVIERRSSILACSHSSERLIPGGRVLIYFYTNEKSQSPLCPKKSGSAAILKNLASFTNESPSTKIRGSGLPISSY